MSEKNVLVVIDSATEKLARRCRVPAKTLVRVAGTHSLSGQDIESLADFRVDYRSNFKAMETLLDIGLSISEVGSCFEVRASLAGDKPDRTTPSLKQIALFCRSFTEVDIRDGADEIIQDALASQGKYEFAGSLLKRLTKLAEEVPGISLEQALDWLQGSPNAYEYRPIGADDDSREFLRGQEDE